MKIAVTATDGNPQSAMDPRFGRSKCFMVFDDTSGEWITVDNVQNREAAQGAGIQAAAAIVNAGCEVLISGHCGPKAYKVLSKAGVAVYRIPAGSTVAAAVDSFRGGTLEKLSGADVEGHW